jgi:hypothetical protein
MFNPAQPGNPAMFIEKLDRHQWTLEEAKQHISRLILAQREHDEAAPGAVRRPEWAKPDDPVKQSLDEARNELFTALRDGDLHATGRLSEHRRERYAAGYSRWEFHSGNHKPISPEHWREGHLGHFDKNLEFLHGDFIDIRVPRFMVLAIWPEPRVEAGRQKPTPDMPYTTAYIELMFTAIRVHGITDEHQSKKELLVDWYKEQAIEEEPISKNLAEAMATLVRHPKSQRGGAKRMIGPDLRETG